MPQINVSAFRNAQPGLGALAQALTGGSGAYEQGREQAIGFQSKIANALAQQQAYSAAADANRARAAQDEQETSTMAGRAGVGDELLAASAGTNVPTVNRWRQGIVNGPESIDAGPPAPAIESSIAQALAKMAPQYAPYRTNTKDTNPEDLAKARGLDRTSALSDAIIAGTGNRNVIGGAQAAAAGKDLFHSGADGGVLDQFAGTLDTSNPMAKSTIGLRGAQAGAQTANAAQSYASAGAANALADQRRAVTGAGKSGPGGKIPIGYRWTTDEAGEAKLEPIPGGPKDPNSQTGKPLPAAASKGYLDNQTNLLRAQKALALVSGESFDGVKGDPEATGIKGMLPNQVLNRVDPKGIETRAALADLGSMVIHDRSGAAVTASEFPRLAPFIPTVYDSKESARKKLQQFEQNYRAITEDAAEFYRASGYNVPAMRQRDNQGAAPAAPAKPAAAAPANGGFKYLGKE